MKYTNFITTTKRLFKKTDRNSFGFFTRMQNGKLKTLIKEDHMELLSKIKVPKCTITEGENSKDKSARTIYAFKDRSFSTLSTMSKLTTREYNFIYRIYALDLLNLQPEL